MSNPYFLAAAGVIVALGAIHSVVGERWILTKVEVATLPVILGSPGATLGALRFSWHAMTLAWWGLAFVLATDGGQTAAWVVVVMFGTMGIGAIIASKGKHLAWVGMLAAAGLTLAGLNS